MVSERPESFLARQARFRLNTPEMRHISDPGALLQIDQMRASQGRDLTSVGQAIQRRYQTGGIAGALSGQPDIPQRPNAPTTLGTLSNMRANKPIAGISGALGNVTRPSSRIGQLENPQGLPVPGRNAPTLTVPGIQEATQGAGSLGPVRSGFTLPGEQQATEFGARFTGPEQNVIMTPAQSRHIDSRIRHGFELDDSVDVSKRDPADLFVALGKAEAKLATLESVGVFESGSTPLDRQNLHREIRLLRESISPHGLPRDIGIGDVGKSVLAGVAAIPGGKDVIKTSFTAGMLLAEKTGAAPKSTAEQRDAEFEKQWNKLPSWLQITFEEALDPVNVALFLTGAALAPKLLQSANPLVRLGGKLIEPLTGKFGFGQEVAGAAALRIGWEESEGLPFAARAPIALAGLGLGLGSGAIVRSVARSADEAALTAARGGISAVPGSPTDITQFRGFLEFRSPDGELRVVPSNRLKADDAALPNEIPFGRIMGAAEGVPDDEVARIFTERTRILKEEAGGVIPDNVRNPVRPATENAAREAARLKFEDKILSEQRIRASGKAAEEIGAGRREGAQRISSEAKRVRAAGKTGTEAFEEVRAGMNRGELRTTTAGSVDVTNAEVDLLQDELNDLLQAGDIFQFNYINTSEALAIAKTSGNISEGQMGMLVDTLFPRLKGKVKTPPTSIPRRGRRATTHSTVRLPGSNVKMPLTAINLPKIRIGGRGKSNALVQKLNKQGRAQSARELAARNKAVEDALTKLQSDRAQAARQAALNSRGSSRRAGRVLPRTTAKLPSTEQVLPRAGSNNNAFMQRITRQGQKQSAAELNANPNEQILMARAEEAASGHEDTTGILNIMAHWLSGNRDILDPLSTETANLISAVQATLTGSIADSYLASLLRRRAQLAGALRAGTVLDDKEVKQVIDALFQKELVQKYGREIPQDVTDLLATVKSLPYDEAIGGVEKLAQQAKNGMFGLDMAVFFQQFDAGIRNGGVQFLAGSINRTLALLNLPHARALYTDANVTKQVHRILDGVDQTASSGIMRPQEGTLLRLIDPVTGGLGSKIDAPYVRFTQVLTDFQFGFVMTFFRNMHYEGDLMMARFVGADITNANVRANLARGANAAGSSAPLSLRPGRRALESATILSPSMTRAQLNRLKQVADIAFHPKASREQKLIGAGLIVNNAFYVLGVGKFLHDRFGGINEFEYDPSKPGFGVITLEDGQSYNLFTQASAASAVAKSFRVLAEGEPGDLGDIWLKWAIGRTTLVGETVFAAGDYGYQSGVGWRLGDLPGGEGIRAVLPLPPIVERGLTEGIGDILNWRRGGADLLGLPNYQESSGRVRDRRRDTVVTTNEINDPITGELLDVADFEELSLAVGSARAVAITEDINPDLKLRDVEELQQLAHAGVEWAQRALIGIRGNQALMDLDSRTLRDSEYVSGRRGVNNDQRAAKEVMDLNDGEQDFGESDNPIDANVDKYFAAFETCTVGGERDSACIDTEHAALVDDIGLDEWDRVIDNVFATTGDVPHREVRLQNLYRQLTGADYYDKDKEAWANTIAKFPQLAFMSTYFVWQRAQFAAVLAELESMPGIAIPQTLAESIVFQGSQQFAHLSPQLKLLSENTKDVRDFMGAERTAFEDRFIEANAGSEMVIEALEFGILRADIEQKDFANTTALESVLH